MICSNCSRENSENTKFCIFCGHILEKEVDEEFDKALDLMESGNPACIELFKQCANQGNSNGYIALGEIYDFGEIVEEDTRKAFDYYQKGLAMGNHMALFHMESLCYCGRMGEENRPKAFGYIEQLHINII